VAKERRLGLNRWSDRTKALALLGLALLIYGFGIGRGFDFDDVIYIPENPILPRSDAFHAFWFTSEAFNYYPLFWSLLKVQWLLWGAHPLGYHLVNLLMHGVNAILVWRIAREWRLPGAWWAAALFAVHPVNVQTVAWAAEQKNTWSFFFMALALLAFIKHARARGWQSYAASLLCFAAALACKTSTVCLPVFLAIYYAVRREKASGAMLIRLVPFFALGFAAGVTTMWFEQHRVVAKSLLSTLSLWQRMETAGASFWFYLGKALLPVGLTPMYRGWVDTTAAAHAAVPGLLLVALLLVCILGWRRIGPPIAFGLIYYALMLLPLLGIFDTNYFAYSLIADHWQYHALPGITVAITAAACALVRRWPRPAPYSNAGGILTVLALAAMASAHYAHFEDARSLWSYVVARNPDAWIGWYNLGNVYSSDRAYPKAIDAYRRSIQIKKDYYWGHFNLANSLSAAGLLEEANAAYLDAEKIQATDADLYNNRAVVLMRLGREDEAIPEFIRALQLNPGLASAHVNLIAILLKRGRVEEAGAHLEAIHDFTEGTVHRLATAITASAQQAKTPRPALQRFARRACELSGNQGELRAALAALESEPPASK
jgi:tetratricopeptide (TPR) repeat protein